MEKELLEALKELEQIRIKLDDTYDFSIRYIQAKILSVLRISRVDWLTSQNKNY